MANPTVDVTVTLQYEWHTNAFPESGDGSKVTQNPDGSLDHKQPSGATWHYTAAVIGPPLIEGENRHESTPIGIYRRPGSEIIIRDKKGRLVK